MKRILIFILSFALLSLSVQPAATDAITLPNEQELLFAVGMSDSLAERYASSIQLLLYSAKGAKHVRFGAGSEFSKVLAESEQLRLLAARGESGDGSVSFYGSGDLEFAIGEASYTLSYSEENGVRTATVLVSDRYDFNGIRKGDSVSVLLNNLGYLLQIRGTLQVYDWVAEVRITWEN